MKKVSIQVILFLVIINYINAQIPFSLSNGRIFIPSGQSILNSSENYYIITQKNDFNELNIHYQSSLLGFDELATLGLGFNLKFTDNFNMYIGGGYFGFELMNELNLTSAIAINFDNLSLGIAGQYNRAYVKDYAAENLFSLDMFAKIHFDDFAVGFLINNISQSQYSNYENTIPQRVIFSVGYIFTENISADIGSIILINGKSSLLCGAKYSPFKELALNIKYLNQNDSIILGLALSPISWLTMNFYFSHQATFGSDYCLINQFKW